MKDSNELRENFNNIRTRRKNGEITEKEYYIELLHLTKDIIDVLKAEDISDNDVKKQVPLIALFITEQIGNLAYREIENK